VSKRLYGYADVGRFGLGHGMLAWARCTVWCHDVGATALSPRWARLRIGPFLRNERDKRFYFKLFQKGYQANAIKRIAILGIAPKLASDEVTGRELSTLADGTVVLFTNIISGNEQKYFHHIIGRQEVVRPALMAMTRPRYRPVPIGYRHIAIHVRGGDFGRPADVAMLTSGAHNQRLPIEWFAEMLAGLRQRIERDVPAIVYSDCVDGEIAGLLAMPNVMRSRYKESVTDMLAMSEANIMISSGSGFSRWGAYLGDLPRICFPGQRHIRVFGDRILSTDLEPEAMTADDLEQDFIDLCRNRLAPDEAKNIGSLA
jgi:hypothetical protein